MASINLKIIDNQINKRLTKILSNIKNKQPFFKKASLIMRKDILEHFNKEQGPQGKWRKLTPLYLVRKKKEVGNKKILQFSGTLKKSITKKVRITKNKLIVKTTIPYAAAHQFGFKNTPKRPFLWLSANANRLILKLASKEFFKKK